MEQHQVKSCRFMFHERASFKIPEKGSAHNSSENGKLDLRSSCSSFSLLKIICGCLFSRTALPTSHSSLRTASTSRSLAMPWLQSSSGTICCSQSEPSPPTTTSPTSCSLSTVPKRLTFEMFFEELDSVLAYSKLFSGSFFKSGFQSAERSSRLNKI